MSVSVTSSCFTNTEMSPYMMLLSQAYQMQGVDYALSIRLSFPNRDRDPANYGLWASLRIYIHCA